jgi:cyclopropane-fatty-acyl-phospholipid synthase
VVLAFLGHVLVNQQTRRRARRNVEEHYDLGSDVFEGMLDPYMQYTCGYWKTATTLDQAQIDKLDLICRKLDLRPGMTVLDLGCGWGGLARFAAERYGVRVTGVTLSADQVGWAERRGTIGSAAGGSVEFRLTDYREVAGEFDRVTMVGMLEHVGPKNHRTAMRVVRDRLKPDGLALVHTIAARDSFPNLDHSELAWINKRIFPGGVLPSLKQVGRAVDGLLVIEDLHNFGAHYDPTLMAWTANFERSWAALRGKYGERFFRMWRYYLLACAGGFRARDYQLWQMVLSPNGVRGGYECVR